MFAADLNLLYDSSKSLIVLGEPIINTKALLGLIILILFVAACGGSDSTPAPTLVRSTAPPPTPRSTPLPETTPVVLLGSEDQPVVLGFVLDENRTAIQDLADQINESVSNEQLERSGHSLVVDVVRLETSQEAVAAICGEQAALVWVDPFTYLAAEQSCGAQPVMRVRQGRRETIAGLPDDVTVNAITGLNFEVVYNPGLRPLPGTLADAADKVVCRLGSDDMLSWVYFSLALRQAGVNPITDLAGIVDVEDYIAMLESIQSGQDSSCDLGAIPAGTLDDLVDELDEELDPETDFGLLIGDWPEIPHWVLVAPPDDLLRPDLRDSVLAVLFDLVEEDEDDFFKLLIPYDSINLACNVAENLDLGSSGCISSSTYNEFSEFLIEAGWAMAPRLPQ